MSAVDYHAIGAAIVTHLQTKLDSDIYLVTQDISQALGQIKVPVGICVLFSGFAHQEALGQSPNTPTRDATYLIGIVARGESDEAQDERIDDTVSLIEWHCNAAESPDGHGWPIFDYTATALERSMVTSAGPKTVTEPQGLTTSMTVEIRIMEV